MAQTDLEASRGEMVRLHLAGRGIQSTYVLDAMRRVPREAFVPPELVEFAYADTPLPIAAGQTISQPYIVARMIEAAEVLPGSRVLEIGAGSGYAAAVLGAIAKEVHAIERHDELAASATKRLSELGYDNVHLRCADGTRGLPEHAPYDAIIVSAAGPVVPTSLLDQLAVGGRLVIPVGATPRRQSLRRITKTSPTEHEEEDLGAVQFVPLIGAEGFPDDTRATRRPTSSDHAISQLIREQAEPVDDIDSASIESLLERIGDARVVLLGEATHGTSEFYKMRARITRELVLRRGFRMVAVEADWPDAATIDRYVRHLPASRRRFHAFARFPTWMWRNEEMRELVEWMHAYNRDVDAERRVSFHGLDLYSLYTSIGEVIAYLDRVDEDAAQLARERYGCLTPWQSDPATYGRAASSRSFGLCEKEVVRILRELLDKRLEYAAADGDDFLDALQNARLVANAERYYRVMYQGAVASWNLRDQHMFDTLEALLAFRGAGSKIIVWEHNSHIGDATATEMSARGEHNVGSLCRARFGDSLRSVGFGTDHGTVAAASSWDMPMEIKQVRPALERSYESLFHRSGVQAGILHLRDPFRAAVREELMTPRLERAIGVIYRPETELQSHYFQAVLPRQFDEYIFFDRTQAVTPLPSDRPVGVPDTYPFGL